MFCAIFNFQTRSSKTGKIKAKKKGKVKITVISGKKKAVCTVKVK